MIRSRSIPTLAIIVAVACAMWLSAAGCSEAPPEQPQVARNEPARSAGPTEPAKSAQPDEPAETTPAAETTAKKPVQQPAPVVKDTSVAPAAFRESNGEVPPVLLTNQHAALTRVKVGDTMPDISLPQANGVSTKLSSMYGTAATVVVLWKGNRGMAIQELMDLDPDVVQPFGSRGVSVVGVAVDETPASVSEIAAKTNSTSILQLIDADGEAFAKVGNERLPWTLVLDPSGKIVWFDIEYSLATRRELQQALLALAR